MNENLIAILILLIYFSPVFYQLGIVIKESKRGNKIPLKRFRKFLKYSVLIIVPIIIGFGILEDLSFSKNHSTETKDLHM